MATQMSVAHFATCYNMQHGARLHQSGVDTPRRQLSSLHFRKLVALVVVALVTVRANATVARSTTFKEIIFELNECLCGENRRCGEE